MKINSKVELKSWTIYLLTVILSVYFHELGHSVYAWFQGYKAIPTPAKSYVIGEFPEHLYKYYFLGGIIGTFFFTFAAFIFYRTVNYKSDSEILAGAIVAPGMYTIRFILSGRGHDETEFQEAQSALGLKYEGHSLDWLFLIVFLLGIIFWVIKSKPEFKILWRLLLGLLITLIFFIALQKLNNIVFDRFFNR